MIFLLSADVAEIAVFSAGKLPEIVAGILMCLCVFSCVIVLVYCGVKVRKLMLNGLLLWYYLHALLAALEMQSGRAYWNIYYSLSAPPLPFFSLCCRKEKKQKKAALWQ